jgi:signal transduction histidine kinase
MLEVEVMDTGCGIEAERQELLFVPFKELKKKQNMKNVKDNNIGMGLSCSKTIIRSLGGDIVLKES